MGASIYRPKTTAEQRPNAYVTEKLGLPRPFGSQAPFRPSERGSMLLHKAWVELITSHKELGTQMATRLNFTCKLPFLIPLNLATYRLLLIYSLVLKSSYNSHLITWAEWLRSVPAKYMWLPTYHASIWISRATNTEKWWLNSLFSTTCCGLF